jgi:uncharacterized membrane protein
VSHAAERLVSRILLLGGLVAVLLMLVGLIGLEWPAAHAVGGPDAAHVVENREAGRATDAFVSLPQVGRALRRRPPAPSAVIAAGIVVLLATPAVALVGALVAFAVAGDLCYAAICVGLLAELVCGFWLTAGG